MLFLIEHSNSDVSYDQDHFSLRSSISKINEAQMFVVVNDGHKV